MLTSEHVHPVKTLAEDSIPHLARTVSEGAVHRCGAKNIRAVQELAPETALCLRIVGRCAIAPASLDHPRSSAKQCNV